MAKMNQKRREKQRKAKLRKQEQQQAVEAAAAEEEEAREQQAAEEAPGAVFVPALADEDESKHDVAEASSALASLSIRDDDADEGEEAGKAAATVPAPPAVQGDQDQAARVLGMLHENIVCPISLCLLEDPVFASDGQTRLSKLTLTGA